MPSPTGKLPAGKGKTRGKPVTERQRWKWWRYNEMFALLDVWSLPNIQEELDGTKRNTHVYNKMSDLLVKRGTKRTPNQVREKMKTLKRAYWTVASKPERELEGKKKILFDRMATILSGRKKPATEEAPAAPAPSPRVESRCERDEVAPYGNEEEKEAGDDKHALHLLLSMGENPCQLREEEEGGCLSPPEERFQNGANHACEVLMNADEDEEITIESPSPSLDIQCGSPCTTVGNPMGEGFPPARADGQDRTKKCHFAEVLVGKFIEAQREMEKDFLAIEEHRLNEELRLMEAQQQQDRELLDKIVEMDERRRQDDREHELRLFAMLAACLNNKNACGDISPSSSASAPLFPFPGRSSTHHVNWEFAGTFRPTNAKPPGSPTRSKDGQN